MSAREDAGHTPGEWRIEGRRGPGYIISAGVNAEGGGPADYVGVLDPMFHVPGSPSRFEADAHLVVAAKAMFEALKRIADAPAWGAPDRWETTPSEVRALARAALSKALPQSTATEKGEG